MRFFEFVVDELPVYDFELEQLREMAVQYRARNLPIVESVESDEFKEFISHYLSDPNSLIIGQRYYVISINSRPMEKTMLVEVSDAPVLFVGAASSSYFLFKGRAFQYRLPMIIESDYAGEPYIISTTVFTTVTEVNQFVDILLLKFGGRWTLSQRVRKS